MTAAHGSNLLLLGFDCSFQHQFPVVIQGIPPWTAVAIESHFYRFACAVRELGVFSRMPAEL
jgi:hypothetical protein